MLSMNTADSTGTPANQTASGEVKIDSELWTTKEASRFLHVSAKTVFNLRQRGLPCVLLGRAVRFVPHEIKDYLIRNRGVSSHRLRRIAREDAN